MLRLGAVAVFVLGLLLVAGAASSSPASTSSGPLIEYWDGTSWQQQVGPNPNGRGWFGAVTAVSASDAWAVGKYSEPSGDRALAAHWDGSSWKQVAMPTPKMADEMELNSAATISTRNVWAVGWAHRKSAVRPLIEHWNGSAWTIVPGTALPRMTSRSMLGGVAAVSARNVWAVGSFGRFPSYRTLVLHWNGRTWKRIPSPNPAVRGRPGALLSGVTVASPRSVWAVGNYSSSAPSGNRISQTLVLHWNGEKWKQVRSANPGGARHFNALYGVAALGRNNVWAVGAYSAYRYGPRLPLVEHWNGHSWRTVPAPSSCPHSSKQPLTDLAALAPNDIWAAGAGTGPYPCDSGRDPTSRQALAEHWDGSAWSVSPIVNPPSSGGNAFFGIAAATPQAVWAVGYYI